MSDRTDLGKKLDKNGAGSSSAQLTTSYTAGDTFNAGSTGDIVLWVEVAAVNASNLTSIQVKLQTSYDGTRWVDVGTISLDATATTTAAPSQSINATANSTVVGAFRTKAHRLLNFHQVLAKATAGGALAAGDAVRVYVKAG